MLFAGRFRLASFAVGGDPGVAGQRCAVEALSRHEWPSSARRRESAATSILGERRTAAGVAVGGGRSPRPVEADGAGRRASRPVQCACRSTAASAPTRWSTHTRRPRFRYPPEGRRLGSRDLACAWDEARSSAPPRRPHLHGDRRAGVRPRPRQTLEDRPKRVGARRAQRHLLLHRCRSRPRCDWASGYALRHGARVRGGR